MIESGYLIIAFLKVAFYQDVQVPTVFHLIHHGYKHRARLVFNTANTEIAECAAILLIEIMVHQLNCLKRLARVAYCL